MLGIRVSGGLGACIVSVRMPGCLSVGLASWRCVCVRVSSRRAIRGRTMAGWIPRWISSQCARAWLLHHHPPTHSAIPTFPQPLQHGTMPRRSLQRPAEAPFTRRASVPFAVHTQRGSHASSFARCPSSKSSRERPGRGCVLRAQMYLSCM